ncbi:hypothetical protein [uncultured Gammaproteobacteria bacterium]|nr:hypothetical protein [uncultured Gammaproteobacteria bacterium]CAC9605165.1 hypothetical protein [uncultured Gammaproteobacteria bacterium]
MIQIYKGCLGMGFVLSSGSGTCLFLIFPILARFLIFCYIA